MYCVPHICVSVRSSHVAVSQPDSERFCPVVIFIDRNLLFYAQETGSASKRSVLDLARNYLTDCNYATWTAVNIARGIQS